MLLVQLKQNRSAASEFVPPRTLSLPAQRPPPSASPPPQRVPLQGPLGALALDRLDIAVPVEVLNLAHNLNASYGGLDPVQRISEAYREGVAVFC